jgi:16S rRNA (uracil1498-N3)-methyltransferase
LKQVRIYQNITLTVGETINLDAEGSHHLHKVLRFPQGKSITLFNGDGCDYTAQVLNLGKLCTANIQSVTLNKRESCLKITLVQALVKGEKMDFIIQKAVEQGVNKIVPLLSERSVVRLKGERLIKRQQHWQKIIISACEQSGRSTIPTLNPVCSLIDFIKTGMENTFVLHHHAQHSLLELPKLTQVNIIIGPEGGLSEQEIQATLQAGAQPLLLGNRILRTETASLAALANLQLLWGC